MVPVPIRFFPSMVALCLVLAFASVTTGQENRKPVIASGPSVRPSPAEVGDSLSLTVSASDPDGDALTYSWNFGDGSPATPYSSSPSAFHRFASPGRHAVTVRIRDSVSAVTGSILVPVHLPVAPGVPAASSPIVHHGLSGRVYAVNPDHGSFTAFDAAAWVRLYEKPTGADPRGIAVAPNGDVWVANRGSATVTVHGHGDGSLLATIKLPYGSRPEGILFHVDGDIAFVSLGGSGKLARLRRDPPRLDGTLDLGPTPRAMALTGDGKRLFVTRFLSPADHAEVWEVDAVNFARARTWTFARETTPDSETSGSGVPNYLASIAIAGHGRTALVAAKKDNTSRGRSLDGRDLTFESTVRTTLLRLDLVADREADGLRTDFDNAALPSAVAFSPRGDLYFAALQGSDRFEVHDLFNSGAVLEKNSGVGAAPMGLALDGDRGRLYVLNFLGRSVSAFDVRDVLSSARFLSPLLGTLPSVDREPLGAEVLAGKRLFYHAGDTAIGRDGYISCAVCHQDGGTDGRVWDFTDRGEGLRRTTTLLGRAGMGHGPVHWSANFDEIQDFEHDLRGPFGGKGLLEDALFNAGTRNRPLGEPKTGLSKPLDALAAYVSSLTRVNASPFRTMDGGFTAEALEGKAIFEQEEVGCSKCHAGEAFTDSKIPAPGPALPAEPVYIFPRAVTWRTADGFLLHDVGTMKAASGKRLGDTLKGIDTPTLKGIWETPPYLHDGSAPDLMAVLTTANPGDRHGKTSHLSPTELGRLVAYMEQLDDGEAAPVAVRERMRGIGTGGRLSAAVAGSGRSVLYLRGVTGAFPSIDILDVRGALVRRFPGAAWKPAGAGIWKLEWDGRDGNGRPSPPGIYLARGTGKTESLRNPGTGIMIL